MQSDQPGFKFQLKSCTNEKVPWIVYVRDFMYDNPDIDQDLYNKWREVIDNEFPGYFDQGPGDQQSTTQAVANRPDSRQVNLHTSKITKDSWEIQEFTNNINSSNKDNINNNRRM